MILSVLNPLQHEPRKSCGMLLSKLASETLLDNTNCHFDADSDCFWIILFSSEKRQEGQFSNIYQTISFTLSKTEMNQSHTCGQFDSNRSRVDRLPTYYVRPEDYWKVSPEFSKDRIDPAYNLIGPVKGANFVIFFQRFPTGAEYNLPRTWISFLEMLDLQTSFQIQGTIQN